MQSRRDQVQAYFFVVGRLVAGLTHGKPDAVEAPNRRMKTGTVLGFVVAGLLVAIFGIYGLFVPGGNESWRQNGAIVMVKETGARYLYLDGQLRPVLNYASARLATGGSGGEVVSVSRKSLGDTAIGGTIGIPGAPDDLPAPDRLDTGPWTVCLQDKGTGPGAGAPTTTLILGRSPGPELSDRQGLLVSTVDGTKYLLWQGKRYRIADRAAADALGYGSVPGQRVTAAWLNPLPAGRDLAVPVIPRSGDPGPVLGGQQSRVGQVYEVRNPAIGSDEMYVMQADGLNPLSRTAAALLLGSVSSKDLNPDGKAVEIRPGEMAGVPVKPVGELAEGYPPPLTGAALTGLAGDTVPCARYAPSSGGAMSTTFLSLPVGTVNTSATPTGKHVAGTIADQVSIPGGSGALVKEVAAPGSLAGTEYLVTATGVKSPLANASVAGALGYARPPVDVPGALLDLLPTGAVLDPAAALSNQAAGS
ncbi:type VII secretion protein EccB [Amycolatopsis sp. NPDC059021]|uniref:type VII secretion protein EccB n=1 Tax=Amycolatopsis sp. NPDC059021 TaxID=3346704 RepID=UPI0036724566